MKWTILIGILVWIPGTTAFPRGEDNVKRSDCEDYYTNCDENAAKGYCDKSWAKSIMGECKKSCPNYCGAAEDQGEDTQPACEDYYTNCDENAAKGYCDKSWAKSIMEKCKKSCPNYCSGTQDQENEQNEVEDQVEDQVDDDASFDKEIMTLHNDYRAEHSTGGLTWSDELASWAQTWADTLAGRGGSWTTGMMDHSDRSAVGYGENIFYSCSSYDYLGSLSAAQKSVKNWYDEIESWNFYTNSKKSTGGVTTHFTQLVWKSTTEVGCAFAMGERVKGANSTYKCTWVVCDYNPKGNQGSAYAYGKNVLPLQ